MNSKPPTIPFGILACTFCDNLSRNIVGPARKATLPSKKGEGVLAEPTFFCFARKEMQEKLACLGYLG